MRRRRRTRQARGVDAFVAVADPTRRRILEILARGERPVHDLAAEFDVSRPAISRHLRILKEAGAVTERLAGRESHYGFRPAGLEPALEWINTHREFWKRRLRRLKSVLDEERE
jgi:DNA-binding transcriptional ArsR family regulator